MNKFSRQLLDTRYPADRALVFRKDSKGLVPVPGFDNKYFLDPKNETIYYYAEFQDTRGLVPVSYFIDSNYKRIVKLQKYDEDPKPYDLDKILKILVKTN
jgi:hypothetical protein